MLAQAFLVVLRAESSGQVPQHAEQEGKKRTQHPQPSSLAAFKRKRGLTSQ